MNIAIYQGKNLHEAELVKIFKPEWYKLTKLTNYYQLSYSSYLDTEFIDGINDLVIENGLIKVYIYE
jgi:hypothetical protein